MSDELGLIRSVLAEPEGPSDQAWTEARAALMAEIEGAVSEGAFSRSTAVRRRRWVPAMGVVSALVVAGAVLLAGQLFVRGGAVQPSPAAAAVLRRAADAALASPPARLKAGEYWYTENEGTYWATVSIRGGVTHARLSEVERRWMGPRRGLSKTRIERVVAEPGARRSQRRAIALAFPRRTYRWRPPSASALDSPVSYARMLRAPRATHALSRWVLHAEVARGFTPKRQYRAQVMFTTIHDILIEPMVPARLQAGLYRVAATISGVHMLGLRHDTLGRSGLAVGFVDHSSGYEDELLFDPTSYALLDYDETTRHRSGSLPAGTITEETAFLAAGLVHRIGQVIRHSG